MKGDGVMKRAIVVIIVLVSMAALLFGCVEKKPEKDAVVKTAPKRTLKFTSSANRAEGFVEWKIDLITGGKLIVMHKIGNQTLPSKTYDMTADEDTAVWVLIDEVFKNKINTLEAMLTPDEMRYMFVLIYPKAVGVVNLWAHDAVKNPDVTALIDQLESVVEKYTGERPDLK